MGLFRRPIVVKAQSATLLTIPRVRIFPAMTADGSSALAQPSSLLLRPSSPQSDTVSVAPTCAGGSVGLVGVAADGREPDEPGELGNPEENTHEGRLWGQVKLRAPGASRAEEQLSLARRLAYLLRPPVGAMLTSQGLLEWHKPLFPYQIEGVQALLSSKELLLADDMGLGKTIQVIAAIRILALQRELEAVLVVVPASLVGQWRNEVRTWAPELRVSTVQGPPAERAFQWSAAAHLYLTTYETLRSDLTENPVCPPRRRVWDVVVLDEAQKIKNPEAEVSRKCKLIPRKRAWALTGTPLENKLEDLASILEIVCPLSPGQLPPKLRADSAMLAKHRRVQLRRKKADVLKDLPPKIVSCIALPLSETQAESYKRAEEQGIVQLSEMGEQARIENVLELILRLKQICNFCPTTGQSAKLDDIQHRLEMLQESGYRALIFSQFKGRFGVEAIARRLETFRPLTYTGSMSQTERQAVIQTFKTDTSRRALVLSLRAGGQGLNLQDASYVFHFDRWWNPAVEHQAEDRSHRLGQEFPVNVYSYNCEGTIEERIDRILKEKQSLFDEVVDDVSIDLRSSLGAEALFGLFGLAAPKGAKGPPKGDGAVPAFGGMSGQDFEGYVKKLLEGRGWTVDLTPLSRDGGIDLISRKKMDAGGEITLYIQCKNYSSPCGVEMVRQLNGVLPKHQPGSKGVVVCPSGFTADGRSFAADRGIILWDRESIRDLHISQT